MRGTKRFERRITVPYFKVGTLKRATGETAVLGKSAGLTFERLIIKGNTVVEIPNRAEAYLEYFTSEENYVPAGINGAYAIALPSEFVGKELTYELSGETVGGGAALYLANGESALFSNLTLLCGGNGVSYKVKGSEFTHLIFTDVLTSDKETDDGSVILVRDGIIDFWKAHNLIITSTPSPDFYSPVKSMTDINARLVISYDGKNKIYTFPKTLTHNGKIVTLRFSLYDEIEINRKKQSVIYRDGSVLFDLTGTESWAIYKEMINQKKGIFAYAQMPVAFSVGFCPYLTFSAWVPKIEQKNVFSVFNTKYLAIKLENTQTDSSYSQAVLSEIVSMLKEKHKMGLDVSILARRRQIVEYDISTSAIGKILLTLAVPRGNEGTVAFKGLEVFGNVEAEYYALDEGESATLTVICLNESGVEISEPREYTLRLGSAYKLTAPEIAGYTPKEEVFWGALKENKTVRIEYEEIK